MRINTNISALRAYGALMDANYKMSKVQLKLATGKRLTSAEEDPPGWSMASTFKVRSDSLAAAQDNIANAKNLLGVAEGSLVGIQSLVEEMRALAIKAADASLSSVERDAIANQAAQINNEVNDLVTETTWQGQSLLAGATSFYFQTGIEVTSRTLWQLAQAFDSDSLGITQSTTAGATAVWTTSPSLVTGSEGSVGSGTWYIEFTSDSEFKYVTACGASGYANVGDTIEEEGVSFNVSTPANGAYTTGDLITFDVTSRALPKVADFAGTLAGGAENKTATVTTGSDAHFIYDVENLTLTRGAASVNGAQIGAGADGATIVNATAAAGYDKEIYASGAITLSRTADATVSTTTGAGTTVTGALAVDACGDAGTMINATGTLTFTVDSGTSGTWILDTSGTSFFLSGARFSVGSGESGTISICGVSVVHLTGADLTGQATGAVLAIDVTGGTWGVSGADTYSGAAVVRDIGTALQIDLNATSFANADITVSYSGSGVSGHFANTATVSMNVEKGDWAVSNKGGYTSISVDDSALSGGVGSLMYYLDGGTSGSFTVDYTLAGGLFACGDTFSVDVSKFTVATLSNVEAGGVIGNAVNVTTVNGARASLVKTDNALTVIKVGVANVGALSRRMSYKVDALWVSETNHRASLSRLVDADMAKLQLESTKLQILQQTSLAMMAQAMFMPQTILSLFGG